MKLTIGMAVYDDFDGACFTLQSIKMHHAECLSELDLMVVDNNPSSPLGKALASYCGKIKARYVPFEDVKGTAAPRNKIFELAQSEYVICVDSHVLMPPGSLRRTLDWCYANPNSYDLYSGPLVYEDDAVHLSTHFDDVWRAQMWGVWATDDRGYGDEPFEIKACGLGLFMCRKEAWLGFNSNFRGFGGEEFYIHEKFRQAGHKCVCLPWLKWWHRFQRPNGVKYPLRRWDKVRNYVIGHTELGLPLDRVKEHFLGGKLISEENWRELTENPSNPPLESASGCSSCQKAKETQQSKTIPTGVTLNNLFDGAKQSKDLGEIAALKLSDLSSKCERVVEFLDSPKSSTIALLQGQPKEFQVYSNQPTTPYSELEKRAGNTKFTHQQARSVDVEIEPADLIHIDTIKTAAYLWNELIRHADKSKRWITIAGTKQWAEIGQGSNQKGLLPALRRLMQQRPQWSVVYHSAEGTGLTVLSCHLDDKPKLPGSITMATNFAKAVAKHVADGVKNVEPEVLQQRLELCTICEQRSGERCAVCGCPVDKKAQWRSESCPLGKWSV